MNTGLVARLLPALAILCLVSNLLSLRGQEPAADDLDRTVVVGPKPDGKKRIAYESVAPDRRPLVGLELGIDGGNITRVAAFRPVYRGTAGGLPEKEAGLFREATVNGRKLKSRVTTTAKVVAKEGYAVAGLTVRASLWISAVQVHFARIDGDRLNLTDAYQSEWYGDSKRAGGTKLESDGRLVVGLTGTADEAQAVGLGLIYSGKPAKPPAAAGAPRPQPERGGLDPKSTPKSGATVKLPAFDTPKTGATKPAPPRRETEAEVKARIEKQNAEAKRQHEQFAAAAKNQPAAMPQWDASVQDHEAAKQVWRKALDAAEADPNLTDERRAEIARFRTALGLERQTNWSAIGVGLGVLIMIVGTTASLYSQRKSASPPTVGRMAAEPLDRDDDPRG